MYLLFTTVDSFQILATSAAARVDLWSIDNSTTLIFALFIIIDFNKETGFFRKI